MTTLCQVQVSLNIAPHTVPIITASSPRKTPQWQLSHRLTHTYTLTPTSHTLTQSTPTPPTMSSQPSPNIDALISGLSSTSLSSSPRHSGDSGSGISTNTAESVDEIGELDEQREDGGVEVVGKDVSTTSGEEGGDKLIGYMEGLHAYTVSVSRTFPAMGLTRR